ncbi:MAG: ribonuclease HI family protein [Phycisphaerae bacterium]|nr:ribonuclease HI family protein [Phycisphaerae bacterium]
MELIIHVDGGARGNPGPAGAGVVIVEKDGGLIYEAGFFLGRQTNNAAEYQALIHALQRAERCGAQAITVYSDSELLVRQITGEYRVKSPSLAKLYEQVQILLLKVPRWTVRHVRREANVRADELANLAMDERRDVTVFDADADTGGEASRPASPADQPSETEPDPSAPEEIAGEVVVPKPERQAIRVTVTHSPDTAFCPADGIPRDAFTVSSTLPAGLCVHAAHAILPTLLAMMNTDPREFASVPTLTVRCAQPGCGAVFRLSPLRGPNGAPRATEA